jgi:FMN reductase
METRPYIVGIGGTARPDSTSERALRASLHSLERLGARTEAFCADALSLPLYDGSAPVAAAERMIAAIRHCDGLIIATPAYHGTLSGLVKNALDYLEELRADTRPYLEGRAVGCIVCAWGPQAIGTAIVSVRSTIHALRGWPTPMAAGINSAGLAFDEHGTCLDPAAQQQLELVARQVWDFALMRHRAQVSGDAPST